MTDERLTLRQAAARLGVSESAIRKRVERGTLRSDRGSDGRRYVYLDTGADKGSDASAPSERDALISEMVEEMRDEVHYLRDQLHQELERRSAEAERYQQIVAALTTANASLSERLRALEPPQEPQSEQRESPQTDKQAPGMAKPSQQEERLPEPGDVRGRRQLAVLFAIGTGVAVGIAHIANLSLLGTPVNQAWIVALLVLWIVPPSFGYWFGRSVTPVLESYYSRVPGGALPPNRFRFFRFPSVLPSSSSPYTLLISIAALTALVAALASGISTWLVVDAVAELSNDFQENPSRFLTGFVIVGVAEGFLTLLFVVFAGLIGIGGGHRRREAAHAAEGGGTSAGAATAHRDSIIGLVGTISTAVIGLIGILVQVFFG